MKMHRKAMRRHTQAVENMVVTPSYNDGMSEPHHLEFYFPGGYTQRLTLTRSEATNLFEALAMQLRYGDTPARDIPSEDWADANRYLRLAITRTEQWQE